MIGEQLRVGVAHFLICFDAEIHVHDVDAVAVIAVGILNQKEIAFSSVRLRLLE